jgi:hypothetical protein
MANMMLIYSSSPRLRRVGGTQHNVHLESHANTSMHLFTENITFKMCTYVIH